MLPEGPLTGRTLAATQAVFATAMIAAFLVAISPLAVESGPDQGDKVAHILAFYGLSLFAAVAHPRANLIVLFLMMSAFGALIELAQGLPVIGRDRDFWDWVADTAASAGALAPLTFARWRGVKS